MIQAVLFDFGQTLVDSAGGFRAAEATAKEIIFEELFPDADSADREVFLAEYRRIRKEYHARSRFSRPAIWQAVYNHFGKRAEEKHLELWESRYWERVEAETTPFPESLDVLADLGRRYKLGLITNTQGQKHAGGHRIALFPQLERFFDAIVVAGEAGVPPKPDPAPFRLCLERLGVVASNAVYVGDDWRIDICGSRDAGLQPVWLKHHSVKRNWPDMEATVPVITRLDLLCDMDDSVLQL